MSVCVVAALYVHGLVSYFTGWLHGTDTLVDFCPF